MKLKASKEMAERASDSLSFIKQACEDSETDLGNTLDFHFNRVGEFLKAAHDMLPHAGLLRRIQRLDT